MSAPGRVSAGWEADRALTPCPIGAHNDGMEHSPVIASAIILWAVLVLTFYVTLVAIPALTGTDI